MPAVEAWFWDGPIDGKVMAVEATADGRLPDVVRFIQSGIYVGASDMLASPVEHIYVRAHNLRELVYQYHGRALESD